jgi:hypothetical protein
MLDINDSDKKNISDLQIEMKKSLDNEVLQANKIKNHKKYKAIPILFWSSSVLLAIGSVSLFVFSFCNLSSQSKTLTQGEILSETSYSKNDSALVRQLKDNALSDWIATRNTTKLTELSANKALLSEIENGTLPQNRLNSTLATLQKNLNATDSEINQLKVQYEIKTLKKDVANLGEMFDNVKLNDYQSQQKIIDYGNSLLVNLNSASSTWLQSDSSDSTLLEQINFGIDEINKIQTQFSTVATYSSLIKSTQTISESQLADLNLSAPFSNQLSVQYDSLTNYVIQNAQILSQQQEIANLKQKLKNTITIPYLVGKTIKQAKNDLDTFNKNNKSNIVLSISGDLSNENLIIISQTPDSNSYDLMKNNGTITVQVQNSEANSTVKSSSTSGSDNITINSSDSDSSNDTQHVDNTPQNSTTVHVGN